MKGSCAVDIEASKRVLRKKLVCMRVRRRMKEKEAMKDKEDRFRFDVLSIFQEAQHYSGGQASGRCPVCGAPFQRGECIECGRSIIS